MNDHADGTPFETLLPPDTAGDAPEVVLDTPVGTPVQTLMPVSEERPGQGDGRPKPRYTLTRLHAEGGLGKVWIARDGDLNREVALKEIKPNHALNDGA